MDKKKLLIIWIIILIMVIGIFSIKIREDLKHCEYDGNHKNIGQMFFEYKCEICGKDSSNSGSKPNSLCRDCSNKYNRCIQCGGKIK